MKAKILIGLMAIAAIACQKLDDSELILTEINEGILFGAGEENIAEGNMVIENEKDWADLLLKMDAVNTETDNFSETEIDFENYIVIACFDRVHNSAGYTIAIDDTEISKKSVVFKISRSGAGPILALVITQPYYIAKFPKTNKNITFKE